MSGIATMRANEGSDAHDPDPPSVDAGHEPSDGTAASASVTSDRRSAETKATTSSTSRTIAQVDAAAPRGARAAGRVVRFDAGIAFGRHRAVRAAPCEWTKRSDARRQVAASAAAELKRAYSRTVRRAHNQPRLSLFGAKREREREHAAYLYRRASGHRRQGVPARVPGATSTPAPRAGLLLRPILTWPNDCGSLAGAITSREGRRGRSERAALDASALVIARGVAMTSRARPPRGRTRFPPPPPPSSGRNPRLELTRASSPPTRAARRARDRDPRRLEVHGRERGPGQG